MSWGVEVDMMSVTVDGELVSVCVLCQRKESKPKADEVGINTAAGL